MGPLSWTIPVDPKCDHRASLEGGGKTEEEVETGEAGSARQEDLEARQAGSVDR